MRRAFAVRPRTTRSSSAAARTRPMAGALAYASWLASMRMTMRSRIAASRCDPNPDSYFHRGSARYRRGEIDAGIEDFCETISLEAAAGTAEKYTSRTPQAFAERGRAFADKGEPERAIADYDAAIQRRFTKAGRLYIERGLARK